MSKLFENEYGLTVSQLSDLSHMYEAHCTAEYLMENHDITEDKAIELGYLVREKMSDYGLSEEEAISEVLEEDNE